MGVNWPTSPNVPVLARPQRVARATATPGSEDLARLRSALDAIPNCGTAELNYETWLSVIFGIHHATGGSDEGLELAHEFSARSSKYLPDFLDNRVWVYVKDERDGPTTTAEAVYALAREAGWPDPSFHEGFPVLEESDSSLGEPGYTPHEQAMRFAFVPAHEFRNQSPLRWIVRDVIPHGGLGMVYGASGAGKTFAVLDLVMAIAGHADEWRGKRVHNGRVLYIVAEGAHGFRRRLEAYAREHDVDLASVDLLVLPAAPNFTSKDAVGAVLAAVRTAGPCSLVVIDTLARVAIGADENSATDMGVVIANAEQVVKAAGGATVLLVHHSGKDTEKGARGSSALRAAMDVEIEVARFDQGRTLTVTKMRDGEDGARFGFKLRTVELGVDEEGEAVTSCVVDHVEAPTGGGRTRLGTSEQKVLDQVRDSIGLDGSLPTCDQVIEAAARTMAGNMHNNRTNAKRALTSLEKKGLVVIEDNRVRLATSSDGGES